MMIGGGSGVRAWDKINAVGMPRTCYVWAGIIGVAQYAQPARWKKGRCRLGQVLRRPRLAS